MYEVVTKKDIIKMVADAEFKQTLANIHAADERLTGEEEIERLLKSADKIAEAGINEYNRILWLKAEEAISIIDEPELQKMIRMIVTVLIGEPNE